MFLLDPKEIVRYVLKAERDLPAEKQSVFLLRPLLASEYARIRDGAISGTMEGAFTYRSAQTAIETVKLGLTGWENVPPGGPPTLYSVELVDRMPFETLRELTDAITEMAEPTRAEEKNSG